MSFYPLKIFFILMVLLKTFFIYAEQVSLKATLDKSTITLEENIVLSVEVFDSDKSPDALILPLLENFLIVKGDRYQKFTQGDDVNFPQITTIFRYLLEPLKSGEFTIEPFILKIGDEKIYSNKLDLTVKKAPLSYTNYDKAVTYTVKDTERLHRDFTLSANASDVSVYKGQPFTVSFEFVRPVGADINNLKYDYPLFENFLKEAAPPKIAPDIFIKEDTAYQKETISFTLSPLTTGVFSLEPAKINFGIMLYNQETKDYEFKKIDLSSKTQEIEVLPLPKKDDLTNMLGVSNNVTIDMYATKTEIALGEETQVAVKITGDGFWQSRDFAICSDNETFFESLISDEIKTAVDKKGKIFSIRTIKKELKAKASGSFEFNDIVAVYFSPVLEKYITLNLFPLEVNVKPKEAKSSPQKHSKTLNAAYKIKDIKKEINSIKHKGANVYKYLVSGILLLLLLVFALTVFRKKQQAKTQEKQANPIQRSGRNRHPRL